MLQRRYYIILFPNYIYVITVVNYCIAGNFRGSKLSRIRPKIIFTELIFTNFIILPFCTVLFIIFANFIFANFIFANLKKSRKERKLLASKVSGYTVLLYSSHLVSLLFSLFLPKKFQITV